MGYLDIKGDQLIFSKPNHHHSTQLIPFHSDSNSFLEILNTTPKLVLVQIKKHLPIFFNTYTHKNTFSLILSTQETSPILRYQDKKVTKEKTLYLICVEVDMESSLMKQSSRFKRVCVFCGSSAGKNPSYQLAALHLAKELVIHYIFLSFPFEFGNRYCISYENHAIEFDP